MNAPWADVGRRWSEAAELLRSASRAPLDVREWLGSGWTGAAADGFAEWGRTFEQATGRAAAALTDAASAAGTLATEARLSGASRAGGPTSGAGELGAGVLSRLEAGVRAVAAVPVPGAQVAPRRPTKPAPKPQRRRTDPTKRRRTDPAKRRRTDPTKRRQHGVSVPKRHPHAGSVPKQAKQSHAHHDGQVRGWIDEARGILHEHGYRPEQTDPDAIAKIIHHESGGNPNAVNQADSNAARGHPSTGLMQTIQPTFNRHRLPGHDQILNPVDNIIAGVRYAVSRYGSVSNVPGLVSLASGGHYKGY